MTCEPTDKELYNKTKKKVYKDNPKHSAYRSGMLVQTYKRSFKRKYGSSRSPYKKCPKKKSSLKRWYKEKWRNQDGKVGYHSKSDVYRPTRRISKKTPKTYSELSKKQIRRARSEKKRTGRVKKFSRKRSKSP